MTLSIFVACAVVLGIVVLKFWVERRAKAAVGQTVLGLDEAMAAKLLQRGKAVLYFYSPTCGMCRAITPQIDHLRSSHDNVFKVDISQTTDLARRLGVMGTPTVMLLQDQAVADVILGPLTPGRLQSFLA